MNTQSLRGPLGWSLASIVVILVFCVYAITTLASPLLQQRSTANAASRTDDLVDKYNQYVEIDIARFKGRSAFFQYIPIVKYVPPIVEVKDEEEDIIYVPPPPPPPPPPPLEYLGPSLIAIIGDEAWFRGSGSGTKAVIRLLLGEEQDGLKLVKTTLPAQVTVEHRGGVYPLDLFDSNESFFKEEPPPVTAETFLEEVEG